MKPPILFVILQSGPLANGGLESITQVMQRLEHFRPVVVTNAETGLSRRWRQSGTEIHIVPEHASAGLRRRPAAALLTYVRYHRSIRRLLRATGAQIVHANDPLAFQLSLSAATLSGSRLVLNLRDTLDPQRAPPRLKFRILFGAADHVLYLSQDMAERWLEVAPNAAAHCTVTYSIVDPEAFAPSEPPAMQPVVLLSGVFRRKKGQLDFIRKVVPVLAERSIQTWFAGDFEPATNAYAAQCAAAAEQWRDHVRFLGYCPDMAALYARASVIAVPSRHEGLMRGMIEAMSCGRPVVSFDICSARELLEEKSGGAGTVVPSGDHDAMARELIRYATDAAARDAAGAKGVAAAHELFDPARVAGRHESAYRALGRD